jgi:hypothetical protein
MSERPSADPAKASPRSIRAGILAYAAGDALGVPWEGQTPDQVNLEVLEELPPAHDWPPGATSDDTDQLMLIAQHLVDSQGRVDERGFLTLLAKALPGMRGPGPSTTAAVRRFLGTGVGAGAGREHDRGGHAGATDRLGHATHRRGAASCDDHSALKNHARRASRDRQRLRGGGDGILGP